MTATHRRLVPMQKVVGGEISTEGIYTTHVYKTVGNNMPLTLQVASVDCDLLAVGPGAGGGGCEPNYAGGGGGGGELREAFKVTLSGSYTMTIVAGGAGGAGGTGTAGAGSGAAYSTINTLIAAFGGTGGGVGRANGSGGIPGTAGGGGGGAADATNNKPGAASTNSDLSDGSGGETGMGGGGKGGTGIFHASTAGYRTAGGGGSGSKAPGKDGGGSTTQKGGNGANGKWSQIVRQFFCGGGGGGAHGGQDPGSSGGLGGGGKGSWGNGSGANTYQPGSAGAANSGGGGGGASKGNAGFAGGSGLIALRYPPMWRPDTVGTLRGWWRADSLVNAVDAANITSWPDSSANNIGLTGVAGTCPTHRMDGCNGFPVVRFDASIGHKLTFASNPMTLQTQGTIHWVSKTNLDPPTVNFRNGAPLGRWGTDTLAGEHLPHTDGSIYLGFGTDARKTVGNVTPLLTDWHIFTIVVAANDWRMYIDGVLVFSTITNTVAWGGAPTLGVSPVGANNYYFDGDLAELFCFSVAQAYSVLNNGLRYLSNKYQIPVTFIGP